MKRYLQNLHTHTIYCDGKDTPEEMVKQAIALGFDTLGFSGHSYMYFSPSYSMSEVETIQYRNHIKALKNKYKDQIHILCGLEFEMFSVCDTIGFDYLIGSTHYFNRNGQLVGFDRNAQMVEQVIREHFGGDGMKYAKAYYENVARLPEYGSFDIIGHLDLVTKHSETHSFFDTEAKEYQHAALDALHAVIRHCNVFEVNTGAIARGYRTTPYPAPFLMQEIRRLGGHVLISSDCHRKQDLNCYFDQALDYVKACGFDHIMVMTAEGLKEVGLL